MDRLPTSIRVLGIGWYVAFCIVAGTVGGLFIDEAAATRPLFTVLGLLLGLAVALIGGFVLLMQAAGIHRPEGRKNG